MANAHGSMKLATGCEDSYESDASAFWLGNIPAYLVTELSSDNNPHYDDTGDDTLAHIDWDYYFHISQLEIAYQAELIAIVDP